MRLTLAGVIASLMVVAGSLAVHSDAVAIEDGLWEMTMVTKMEGLSMALPPTVITVKQCLTKKDLIPKDPNEKNCTYKNVKTSGNKVSWEVECDQDGSKMSGKGNMTYSGSTCSGTSKMDIESDGNKITASMKTKGKRLGKCNGEEQSVSVDGRDVKETQKVTEDLMAMSKMAQAKMQAGMQAETERGLEFISSISIPKGKPDACEHVRNAFSNMPGPGPCNDKWGDLNIQAGEWEITEEYATKQGDMVIVHDSPKVENKCLSPFSEPSYTLADSKKAKKAVKKGSSAATKDDSNLKRSGNTITWNSSTAGYGLKTETEGGIEFKGNTYEGGSIERTTNGGLTETIYKRITAKRIGDGSCVGRDGTAKNIQSQRKTWNEAAPAAAPDSSGAAPVPTDVPLPGDVIQNPVRKIRNLFGF